MLIKTLKLQAKLLRRARRRTIQRRRYPGISIAEMPILFGNSFPKSGTHLLTQILAAFSKFGLIVDSALPPILTFDGPTGKRRAPKSILQEINRLLPGDVAYGHLHALPATVIALCRDGIAPFFIYRDPRDVVVSHVHYVTEIAPNHVHHNYYKHELLDFDQRVRTSILGRPDIDISFPDTHARFEPYLPWLDQSEVMSLRFEDFITQLDQTIGRVLDHAVARGFITTIPRADALEILAAGVNPKRSPTFRSGKVGGWRDSFTDEHKRLFKDVTGDLLTRLGYEKNSDW